VFAPDVTYVRKVNIVIRRITDLLAADNVESKSRACGALSNIGAEPRNLEALSNSGLISQLVPLLRPQNDDALLAAACRATAAILSQALLAQLFLETPLSSRLKPINYLASLLTHTEVRVVVDALDAVCALANHAVGRTAHRAGQSARRSQSCGVDTSSICARARTGIARHRQSHR